MKYFPQRFARRPGTKKTASKRLVWLVPCLLLCVTVASALPPGLSGPFATKAGANSFVAERVDREVLLAEDVITARQGRGFVPLRYAVGQTVSISPSTDGVWSPLGKGWEMWRLEISAPGALSLSTAIEVFDVPADARMWVYDRDGAQVRGPFTSADRDREGGLTTPIILGDGMVVELAVPTRMRAEVRLEVSEIYRGYQFFGEDREADKRGSCNINVVCPEGDAWRDQIRSVAFYVSGGYLCSGTLVNNTAEDNRPLFLTAGHCSVTAANSHSMQVYWNYESPTCEDFYGGSLSQYQTGATLLAEWGDVGSGSTFFGGDMKLLELDAEPDEEFNVHYAGWDVSATVPQAVAGIHHPGGDQKSICFEDDPLDVTSYIDFYGENNWLRVNDWDLGTTEGGSSGSCIFDQTSGLCVGTLSGGYAACGNDDPDWYGWLHRDWEGGGTAESRLKDWLDPLNSDVTSLQGRDPGGATPPARTLWLVPAAASTPGYGTSDWKTQLVVANPSDGVVTADLFFVESGQEWPGVQIPGAFAIPAGGALYLDDVLADQRPTSGLMYVGLDSAAAVVSTRTYNLADGGVTFGQGIPGIRLDQTKAASTLILPLVHSIPGRFRTNLGLVQTSAGDFRVQVTVHDPTGAEIATGSYRPTAAFTQINNVLNDLGVGEITLEGGWIEVTLTLGSPAYWTAYASVVDDGSNDPTYVIPVEN